MGGGDGDDRDRAALKAVQARHLGCPGSSAIDRSQANPDTRATHPATASDVAAE